MRKDLIFFVVLFGFTAFVGLLVYFDWFWSFLSFAIAFTFFGGFAYGMIKD